MHPVVNSSQVRHHHHHPSRSPQFLTSSAAPGAPHHHHVPHLPDHKGHDLGSFLKSGGKMGGGQKQVFRVWFRERSHCKLHKKINNSTM